MTALSRAFFRASVLLTVLFLSGNALASPAFPEFSLKKLGKDLPVPEELLGLLQKKLPRDMGDLSGETYGVRRQGWRAFFSLLPPSGAQSINLPGELRRAEEASYSRAAEDLLLEHLEGRGEYEEFAFLPLLARAQLLRLGKRTLELRQNPGVWKRSGFLESRAWNLLVLPPGGMVLKEVLPPLPASRDILPLYRELCLQEARQFREKGTPKEALPLYREMLRLSPLGPATPLLLEYCAALLESGEQEEARDILRKTAEQRREILSPEEAGRIRQLWHTLSPGSDTFPTP